MCLCGKPQHTQDFMTLQGSPKEPSDTSESHMKKTPKRSKYLYRLFDVIMWWWWWWWSYNEQGVDWWFRHLCHTVVFGTDRVTYLLMPEEHIDKTDRQLDGNMRLQGNKN